MSRPPSSRVAADRLTYRLPEGRDIVRDLSLGFGTERTGIVGANGSGKTTLARLLAGALPPTAGRVLHTVAVGYLPQLAAPVTGRGTTVASLLGIDRQLAALDRLLAGGGDADDVVTVDSRWSLREDATRALVEVGLPALPLDRALGAVSGGEATRLALAALLLRHPDFLILDEPTNNLDREGRAAIHALVAGWTGGMIVVSHDRELLMCMDRMLEMSSLGVAAYGGNYAAYRAQRDLEGAAAERSVASARTELRRVERSIREVRERKARQDARGQRGRATANQSKLILNLKREQSEGTAARVSARAERLRCEGREQLATARARVAQRQHLAFDIASSGLHVGKRVLELRGVRFRWPGVATLAVDVEEFRLHGPARVAVTGPNGSGKSTLLRLLAGTLRPDEGEVTLGVAHDDVAYLDQHVAFPLPDRSVLDNVVAGHPAIGEGEARDVLAAFLFRGDAVRQDVATLSGGERIRAALARRLAAPHPPKLLLLDEPTNHLDLDGIEAVERALAGYDGAIVVVSHDERFLQALGVDRVLRPAPGR